MLNSVFKSTKTKLMVSLPQTSGRFVWSSSCLSPSPAAPFPWTSRTDARSAEYKNTEDVSCCLSTFVSFIQWFFPPCGCKKCYSKSVSLLHVYHSLANVNFELPRKKKLNQSNTMKDINNNSLYFYQSGQLRTSSHLQWRLGQEATPRQTLKMMCTLSSEDWPQQHMFPWLVFSQIQSSQ